MTSATVFGIEIVDCSSRLVAADAAEDRGLTTLAFLLRVTATPLVLEPVPPHALVPNPTEWVTRDESGARVANLALRTLARAAQEPFGRVLLRWSTELITPNHPGPAFLQRIVLDAYFESPEGKTSAIGVVSEAMVSRGIAIVETKRTMAVPPCIHISVENAHRFGLMSVPVFPD